MTRNTKLYKLKTKSKEYIYRDLTVNELSFLQNINNDARRNEIAGQLALYKDDPTNVPWPILDKIGLEAIKNSTIIMRDKNLFDITVKEVRNSVSNDEVISLIIKIATNLNESILKLINLTIKDLIELGCICEIITKKSVFNVKSPIKGSKRANLLNAKKEVSDKPISEQIEELNEFINQ